MTKNKRLTAIIVAIPVLLLVPLIAMQFSPEVYWTISDFIIMGILLLAAGLSVELVLRKVKEGNYRVLWVLVVLAIFFLIYAELAVGVLGTPFVGC